MGPIVRPITSHGTAQTTHGLKILLTQIHAKLHNALKTIPSGAVYTYNELAQAGGKQGANAAGLAQNTCVSTKHGQTSAI